jgi:uncharacterized lipoprotein YbaY/membrane-bound inhibitor of C-type lysozyme
MTVTIRWTTGFSLGCAMLSLSAGGAWADATMRALTGTLTYAERIALPDDAAVVLTFRDRGDAPIASDRAATEGQQVPLAFRLWVPAGRTGTFVGEVEAGGATAWRTQPVAVAAGTGPLNLGELRLEQAADAVQPAPADVTEPAPAPDPEPPAAAMPEPAVEDAVPDAPAPEPEPEPQPEPEVAEPETGERRFLCGETEVTAILREDRAEIVIGGITVEMAQVPAASGSRYELPDDPDTFFWDRGDRALVSLAGELLEECEPASD